MDKYSGDMIVNLTKLPDIEIPDGIKIKRAFAGDKRTILEYIAANFSENWIYEAEKAILQNPCGCFIATREGELVGFACFDSTAKGFFGPIGVSESERGGGIGAALLVRTLYAMRDFGYGYGIIGWVNSAEMFYRKVVNAEYIKGGEPENSVYSGMIHM